MIEGIALALATIVVATIQVRGQLQVAKLQKAVGTPNGKGNVVQMNEEQIRRMDRLEQRFDSHLEWHVTRER